MPLYEAGGSKKKPMEALWSIFSQTFDHGIIFITVRIPGFF